MIICHCSPWLTATQILTKFRTFLSLRVLSAATDHFNSLYLWLLAFLLPDYPPCPIGGFLSMRPLHVRVARGLVCGFLPAHHSLLPSLGDLIWTVLSHRPYTFVSPCTAPPEFWTFMSAPPGASLWVSQRHHKCNA